MLLKSCHEYELSTPLHTGCLVHHGQTSSVVVLQIVHVFDVLGSVDVEVSRVALGAGLVGMVEHKLNINLIAETGDGVYS